MPDSRQECLRLGVEAVAENMAVKVTLSVVVAGVVASVVASEVASEVLEVGSSEVASVVVCSGSLPLSGLTAGFAQAVKQRARQSKIMGINFFTVSPP